MDGGASVPAAPPVQSSSPAEGVGEGTEEGVGEGDGVGDSCGGCARHPNNNSAVAKSKRVAKNFTARIFITLFVQLLSRLFPFLQAALAALRFQGIGQVGRRMQV